MADGNKVSFQSNTACLALHHHRVLSDMAKQSIISAATEIIFSIAWVQHPEDTDGNYDRRLALDHTKDFLSMMTGYESVMQKNINTDLNVYILQTSDYENIRSLASNIGYYLQSYQYVKDILLLVSYKVMNK